MKNWFRKRSTVLQPPMPSGRHSLRLALEPRLVFDAAALAPIPDQAALAGAKPGHHDGPVPAAPADAPAEAAPQGQPHDLAAPDFAALYAAPVRGDGSRPDAPLPPPAAVTEAAAAQAPAGTDARPDASRTPVFDAQADAQADGRAAGSPADRNLSGNDSQAAASAGRVVAVVDSSLEGWRTLADDLSAKAQVVVVGAEGTDLAGVARALASGGPVDSLQIFAHGSAGTVHLGGETIDAAALDGPLGQVVRDWSASLSQSGDILVFGCDVGAGDQGAAFVDKLAALTGADVAASTDAVGRGDFGLERTAGAVESGLALSERDAAGYDRLLAAPTIAQNVIYDANSRVTPEDTVLAITDVTVADADGGTLTVTLAATHGKVQVTTTGGLTVTGNNSASLTLSGSVASLNASLATLKYAPDADYNSQAGAASIAMTVNDGATTTNKTLNVEVTPVNDPSGLTLNPVSVNEGQTNVTLTAAALNVTDASKAFNMLDPDNVDQQIMFVIDALPTKGTLTLNGLPVDVGSNLSYADLLAGKFKYSANGSNVAAGDTDSFALNLQDGAGGSTLHRVLTINLQPVNDAPTVSGSAVVYEGQPGVAVSVTVTDRDDAAANHVYDITAVNLNGEGTLFLDNDGNHAYGAGDTLIAGPVTGLTAAQAAKLTFSHAGGETNLASPPRFTIVARDQGGGQGAGSALASAATNVTLSIRPVDDDPTLTRNNTLYVDVDVGGGRTVISSAAHLAFGDVDSTAQEVRYVVVSTPTHGELTLTKGGATYRLQAGSFFTQADLDAGLVGYWPTSVPAGTNIPDSFTFKVFDGALKAWTPAGDHPEGAYRNGGAAAALNTFNIVIDHGFTGGGSGGGSFLPGLPVLDAVTLQILNIPEQQADGADPAPVTITSAELSYSAANVSAGSIVYTITSAPAAGSLQKLVGGVWTDLHVYDNFTQADVNGAKIRFQPDKTSEHFRNPFTFSVTAGGYDAATGGILRATGTFVLENAPVNDAPTVSASTTVLAKEGAYVGGEGTNPVRLTTAMLNINDPDGQTGPTAWPRTRPARRAAWPTPTLPRPASSSWP